MITSQQIKAFIKKLGGDLAGVSSVERFSNAPIRMSPKGHLPSARSVIVAAVHTPDGAWELGGEPIHNWGSASVVTAVNARLERIGFHVARLLEDNGYKAIPIPQTAIWRYREYEDLDIVFSPDMSHIHAAAAAGLGEIGYNGLLLTPEYGARQRLMTIITEADLEQDPLYTGPVLCDRCMECVRVCSPSKGLVKEVKGLTKVDIGGRIFEYANKNKFRCAWAERFQIRYDIDIPDKVNEDVIVPNLACNREGYGSSLEPCWRYCLPPYLRMKKEARKPNHRKSFWIENPDIENKFGKDSGALSGEAAGEAESFSKAMPSQVSRMLAMEIQALAFEKGIDVYGTATKDDFKVLAGSGNVTGPYKLSMIPHPFNEKWGTVGTDPSRYLDDVQSVIVIGMGYPSECAANGVASSSAPARATHLMVSGLAFQEEYKSSGAIPAVEAAVKEKIMDALLDITRHLEEKGYSAVGLTYLADNYAALACGLGTLDDKGELVTEYYGRNQIYTAILTSAPLNKTAGKPAKAEGTAKRTALTAEAVKAFASSQGSALTGIAPAARFRGIKDELRRVFDEKACGTSVKDHNERMGGHNVDLEIMKKENVFKDPWDYMEDAESVIVIGANVPATIAERAEKPPAESVGVYSMYMQHAAWVVLDNIALDIVKFLNSRGYKAIPVEDLNGTASRVAHTFGEMVDARANAYAAMLAGLGRVTICGNTVTPEYGLNQKFFAIVTNAKLEGDKFLDPSFVNGVCRDCTRCIKACPVGAISEKTVVLNAGGTTWKQNVIDILRCDWCKRYALVGDGGPKYMGSRTNIMPPEEVTAESIAEAIKKMDPLQKRIPCIVEKCVLECPYSGRVD
ncbi:MAG: hypothetical protein PHG48_02945 [Eubacteriales bacterium]|nr:hypothetical protein [Eubacteriales bacterium]